MPGTKRTSKVVSYKENGDDDDDDDFVSIVDHTKKNRPAQPKDLAHEAKTSAKSPSSKPKEKSSKVEQPEVDAVVRADRKSSEKLPMEVQSTVNELPKKESEEIIAAVDPVEETSPRAKRMKQHDENTPTESPSLEEDEEEEVTTHDEIPIIPLTDLDASRHNTSTRPNDSPPRHGDPKRRHSAPLGFPTSKINIPSLPVSRVGLSRKSSTIKPLHPTLNARPVHP